MKSPHLLSELEVQKGPGLPSMSALVPLAKLRNQGGAEILPSMTAHAWLVQWLTKETWLGTQRHRYSREPVGGQSGTKGATAPQGLMREF